MIQGRNWKEVPKSKGALLYITAGYVHNILGKHEVKYIEEFTTERPFSLVACSGRTELL